MITLGITAITTHSQSKEIVGKLFEKLPTMWTLFGPAQELEGAVENWGSA